MADIDAGMPASCPFSALYLEISSTTPMGCEVLWSDADSSESDKDAADMVDEL